MIQGDIDLTEKLDFYHDKPKEKLLPAGIPWKKDANIKMNKVGEWFWTNTINNWGITDTSNNYNFYSPDQTRSIFTQLTYFYNDYSDRTTTSFTSNFTYYNNSASTTTDPTRLEFSNTGDSWNIVWTDTGNATIKTWVDFKGNLHCENELSDEKNSSSNLPYKVKPRKQPNSSTIYCNCCGKKFIGIYSQLTSYCKDCAVIVNLEKTTDNAYNNLKRLDKKSKRCRYESRFQWSLFPWDNDGEYHSWRDNIDSIDDVVELRHRYRNDKERLRSIPWLSELRTHIFSDYKDELENGEKNYLSYLTNMDWLRIH